MRNRTAEEYERGIDWSKISQGDTELARKRLSLIVKVDDQLFTLKAQRRALCDYLLELPRIKKGGEE